MLYDPKWETPTEAKPLEPWRQLLLKAADLIETRGHCKNVLREVDGRLCAYGAMNVAAYGDYRYRMQNERMAEWIEAEAKLEEFIGGPITDWNNARKRIASEVIGTMRGCARNQKNGRPRRAP